MSSGPRDPAGPSNGQVALGIKTICTLPGLKQCRRLDGCKVCTYVCVGRLNGTEGNISSRLPKEGGLTSRLGGLFDCQLARGARGVAYFELGTYILRTAPLSDISVHLFRSSWIPFPCFQIIHTSILGQSSAITPSVTRGTMESACQSRATSRRRNIKSS